MVRIHCIRPDRERALSLPLHIDKDLSDDLAKCEISPCLSSVYDGGRGHESDPSLLDGLLGLHKKGGSSSERSCDLLAV